MKKGHWLAIGAAALLSMAGISTVNAEPGWQGGKGFRAGACGNCIQQGQQSLSPEAAKARAEFMEETAELRKQLVIKNAEVRALMAQTNPDEKKVAAATGEAYDLRNTLRQKAVERGVEGGLGFQNCGQENQGFGRKGGSGYRTRGA
jgi:Spy/CpxP family protein refolding chaperone